MQTITTKTGKVFEVNWCGASTLDYALRFEAIGQEYADIFLTFANPEETKKLTHVFDENRVIFYNYTNLKSITAGTDGTFIVSLNPKALENINKEDFPTDEEIQNGKEAIEILSILFGEE